MANRISLTIFLIIIAAAASTSSSGEQLSQVNLRTFSLDVESLTTSSYNTFLRDLRRQLANQFSHGVAVLPLQNDALPIWFDLVLSTSRYRVPVRIRADNLYVTGYQMQDPRQQWMEFGRQSSGAVHLIPGSEFLGFGESYTDLVREANQRVTEIELTKQSFVNTVETLARSTVRRDRAKSLIVVLQMIAEASRFIDVSDLLASNLNKGSSRLVEWMKTDLENNWETFSNILLWKDQNPCYKFPYGDVIINNVRLTTFEQLRSRFGIILKTARSLIPPPCTTTYEDDEQQLPNLIVEYEAKQEI